MAVTACHPPAMGLQSASSEHVRGAVERIRGSPLHDGWHRGCGCESRSIDGNRLACLTRITACLCGHPPNASSPLRSSLITSYRRAHRALPPGARPWSPLSLRLHLALVLWPGPFRRAESVLREAGYDLAGPHPPDDGATGSVLRRPSPAAPGRRPHGPDVAVGRHRRGLAGCAAYADRGRRAGRARLSLGAHRRRPGRGERRQPPRRAGPPPNRHDLGPRLRADPLHGAGRSSGRLCRRAQRRLGCGRSVATTWTAGSPPRVARRR